MGKARKNVIRNKTMRFNAFELGIENGKLLIDDDIYVLKFPRKLYDFLVMTDKKRKDDEVKNIYIKPLSDCIKSLYADVITANNVIREQTIDKPWLYSFTVYNLKVLKLVILDWLEERANSKITEGVYSAGSPGNIEISESFMDELQWEKQPVEMSFPVNSVGTAQPDDLAYNFLPSYISHKISGKLCVKTASRGDEGSNTISTYEFFNVSVSEKGAELISWEPKKSTLDYKDGSKQDFYWTYKIILTLQTIPFSSKPYLFIDVETLKFCSSEIHTRSNKDLSPYIRITDSKIKSSSDTSFIRGSLKRVEEGKGHWVWAWDRGFMHAAESLMFSNVIPRAEEIINNPLDYIVGNKCMSIAVPHGTHIIRKHEVGSGVAFTDRVEIINSTKEAIGNIGSTISELIEDFVTESNICPDDSNRSDTMELRFKKMPDILNIEAYYCNQNWLDSVLGSVEDVFNEKINEEEITKGKVKRYSVTKNKNEVLIEDTFANKVKKVIFEPINLSDWDENGDRFFEIANSKEGYEEFVKKLKAKIRKTPNVLGALFELEDYRNRTTKSDSERVIDPKLTIRKVMAEKNRLVQFITPVEISDGWKRAKSEVQNKHKFISGFRDLLRQFGFINIDISDFRLHDEKDVLYIGVWFYGNEYKRKFPVLVAIKDNEPFIAFYKEEERDVKWQRYIDGQIELGTDPGGRVERNRKFNTDNLRGFIMKAIAKIKTLTGINDIVVYTVAQNCRQSLPWFTNGNIGVDEATLTIVKNEMEEKYNTVVSGQKLNEYTLIRLRTSSNRETPTWTVIDKEGYEQPTKRESGVFQINEKVFYSIQGRPASFKMSSEKINSTKVELPFEEFRRQNVLEICIPSIENKEYMLRIASLTHFLRKEAGIQYDESTEFPLPVHLAKGACEYAEAYYEKIQPSKSSDRQAIDSSILEDENIDVI